MAEDVALSVVVLAYRNRATVARAVTSLVVQRCAEPFEVVVVASGGDGSADVVREQFPAVTVVDSTERLLPGGARNAGVHAALGELVAFLAADSIATPGWVAARLAAHRAGYQAVGCALTPGPPVTAAAWAIHFDMVCRRLPGRPAGVVAPDDPAAHGLSYSRELLARLGPFDDEVLIGEDTETARRIGELGVEIWFAPDAVTAHGGPRTVAGMVREARRRAAAYSRYAPRRPGAATTRADAVRAFVPTWWRGVRRRTALSWRNGTREDRRRLVQTIPLLALVRASALVGWYGERLRSVAVDGSSTAA